MNLLIFSNPHRDSTEIESVIKMFDLGMKCFHLRKPSFTKNEFKNYIEQIPEKYRKHIVIHAHHKLAAKYRLKGVHYTYGHRKKSLKRKWSTFWFELRNRSLIKTRSCHHLSELDEIPNKYTYVFLSPVFDTISKKQHSSFEERAIKALLPQARKQVIALGGVTPGKIKTAYDLGFTGVALLGSIWKSSKNPVDTYLDAVEEINKLSAIASSKSLLQTA